MSKRSYMIIFKSSKDLQFYIAENLEKQSVGFVPTMGALHQGHIALVTQSLAEKQFTVCSIFVNPTQFNDPKDFEKYPITLEKDIELLEAAGCDALFLPSVSEIYPNGTAPLQNYELGFLETVLEGKFRPGHFQGVCNVVHRLLLAVPCNKLYLGQKDYQQCMVISRLIEIIDSPTEVVVCSTKREADGLAMSSRNMRLLQEHREQAPTIYLVLSFIKSQLAVGSLLQLKSTAIEKLTNAGFKIDYVEVADAKSLELIYEWDGKSKLVAFVAAFIGDVRLIDNLPLN